MDSDLRHLDATVILNETRSLRALARAIVTDVHVADDLVQEAWLTAIARPPKQGWSLGRWLAGITRNHARDHAREGRRRDRRERAAARPEQAPGDDSVERVDLLQHLLGHVRTLGEPYRATVLARYFDGLDPREIARLDGVPPATVRTRLRRAIEILRDRMDDTMDGKRHAWVLPLIPFAAAPDPVLGPVSAGTGSEAMARELTPSLPSMTTVVTSVVLAITVPFLVTFWPRTDGEPDNTAQVHETPFEPSNTGRASSGRTDVSPVRLERPTQPVSRSQFVIHGFVVDSVGRPVAEAAVRSGKRVAESRSDGSYTLLLPIETRSAYEIAESQAWGKALSPPQPWVRAEASGYGVVVQELGPPEGGSRVRVDFELGTAVTARGRVLDRAGRPIPDASVSAHRRADVAVRSARDGSYEFAGLDARVSDQFIYARADGFVTGRVRVEPHAGVASVDIVLDRGATVRGRIVGAQRDSVADAFIQVGFDHRKLWAQSDSDGRYSLTGVPDGRHTLVVRHREFAVHKETVVVSRGARVSTVDVVLDPGRRITGIVVGRDGVGLTGAEVLALAESDVVRAATTYDGGRFELDGLPKRKLKLWVRADGHRVRFVDGDWPEPVPLTIKLAPAGRIGATITDAVTGDAIENFEVRIIEPTGSPRPTFVVGAKISRVRDGWKKVTGTAGRWLSPELDARFEGEVEVRAHGYAPTRVRVTASSLASADDRRIRLPRGIRLAATVLLPGGRPLSDAGVRVIRADAPGRNRKKREGREVRADGGGRFVLDDLGPGAHWLTIELSNDAVFVHQLKIPEGVVRWHEFVQLGEQGRVTGVARSASGEVRPGALIELSTLDVPGLGKRTWKAEADGSGRFTFAHVPFGRYVVAHVGTVADTRAEMFARAVTLRTGSANAEVDLRPTGSARIHGTLTLSAPQSDGAPEMPSEVLVRLAPRTAARGRLQRILPRAVVAKDGRFDLVGVEPGRYKVSAEVRLGRTAYLGAGEVEVSDGETKRFDIELERRSRTSSRSRR